MKTELGVIEGFYGRPYSCAQRLALMDFLGLNEYSFYIYAPKNDPLLRRNWKLEFEPSYLKNLAKMSDSAHNRGIEFGVGISPLGLAADYESLRALFLRKLCQLAKEALASRIYVLFDDINLNNSHEGLVQNYIVNDAAEVLKPFKVKLAVCPSYYSFDPILDKVFGKRPKFYFQEFSENLDPEIEILWTGNKVLSPSIKPVDVEQASLLFGRKISLWDNYPVNDGRKQSSFVFTSPFANRENLDGKVLSHVVNPMKQAYLSMIPLSSLPLVYQGKDQKFIVKTQQEVCRGLFGSETEKAQRLLRVLEQQGLEGLTWHEKLSFEHSFAGKGCAFLELVDTLNGGYAFDPNCLTS